MTSDDRKFLKSLSIPAGPKRTLVAIGSLIKSCHTKVISRHEIGEKTFYCRKQIYSHIAWLESAGLIRVERNRVHEFSKRMLANRITCYAPSYFPSEATFVRWYEARLATGKVKPQKHPITKWSTAKKATSETDDDAQPPPTQKPGLFVVPGGRS